ncbi:hypothetical protein NMG29_34425 [Streptomyces cocklensis]|jgi:hypothetical protein|uniref:Uncharacterized protein n=1 Tax=Actinacidiphila cocklensis TaxID=887465 RepID=A0A9W4DTE9_9ACTN|nr:hypothetical protein [Actinacidiphila cocklensis]MDD1063215.1 hypothetical protein [Actinacidiphila cocklensis]CAG6393642.1 conserved hypothetical protein [Actinacidiphila cocklensis]
MGNIYDYYAAIDDTQALALFEDDCMGDPFGTTGLKGADPYLLLLTVEAHLTGVSKEQVEADPRFCELLNDPEHDGPWLVSLTDTLRDALAAATPERLLETATAWTHTEDGGGQDPGLPADFLGRLAELARDAGPRRRLYCGMHL